MTVDQIRYLPYTAENSLPNPVTWISPQPDGDQPFHEIEAAEPSPPEPAPIFTSWPRVLPGL